MTEYDRRLDALEGYPIAVKHAIISAHEDGQLTDLLGILDANNRQVASHRKDVLSEIPDYVTGKRYEMAPKGGRHERSYNFSTLLSKLMDGTGMKLLDLLIYLRERDVIRISWQWTNLVKVMREYNVDLVTTTAIVTDGDSADVGQRWKDGSPSFTRIEEES